MVSPTQAIGNRIATLRLSQRKLAAMLGVSQPALNGWLNGHTRPPTGFAEQATEILNVVEEAERAADAAQEQVLARVRELQPCLIGERARRHAEARGNGDSCGPDVAPDELPDVLFLEDLAALLRCHPKTIKRRLEAHVFPVAPIPGIDRRPRWSKAAVLRWLAAGGAGRKPAQRRWMR